MFDSNWLLSQLQSGVCNVTFTKVDGSQRNMRCTLNSSFLPEEYQNKGMPLSEYNRASLSVWDLEANGWRSFRIENVVSISAENTSRPQLLV
jgi:hypothetical protein